MANINGIYVPFIVDVDGGMEYATQRAEELIKEMIATLSKETLKLQLDIDDKGIQKTTKKILSDSKLTADNYKKAMESVERMMKEAQLNGGFNFAEGLTQQEREMVTLYEILAQKRAIADKQLDELISKTKRYAEENYSSLQEVKEYWSKIDSIINTTGNSFREASIRMKAAMTKLQATPVRLDDGNLNPEFTRLVEIVKQCQKVVFEYQTQLANLNNTSRQNIDILREQEQTMSVLNRQMSEWRKILENSKVGSSEFKEAASEIAVLADELAKANYQFQILSTNKDSIKQVSVKIAELNRQWSEAGASKKFASNGEMTAWAKQMVDKYQSLAEYSEHYGQSLEQIVAKKTEMLEHARALNTIGESMNALNQSLTAWTQELNSAKIDSPEWKDAADHVRALSEKIRETNEKLHEMGFKTGSIDQLNARVQSLTRQWNELGKRFDDSGKMTAKAQKIYNEYAKATRELQKQGRSMSDILSKQEALNQKLMEDSRIRKRNELILTSEARSIDRIRQKIQLLTEQLGKVKLGSDRFKAISREINELNRQLEVAQGNTRGLNTEMGRSSSLLSNLIRKSLYLFSLRTLSGFIRNIRKVTSEFEMQRVALAGIIQDTAKAEGLFKQIKAAAIKSPFEIKDLVRFTKQLSAYRIETDKLFDVTMKLADVSAGLGVDMNRLVLAYGQVRAASVLRGQELRQFTEAGIPLVELLADKFTKLNGRMVSTAEVFELISKRAVPFSMIEQIFDDMTEAGGIFYKMQEKQSETLLGQWQKLKDAASIMYDEMGNVKSVHNAMESLMAFSMRLMQNWRLLLGAVKAVGWEFLALKAASMILPNVARNTMLAKRAEDAFARSVEIATIASNTNSTALQKQSARLLKISLHLEAASRTTNIFRQTWHRMAASVLSGNWIAIVGTAAVALIGYLISARREAQRLGKELTENIAKGDMQAEQLTRNFNRLANAAVTAAEGSAEQRDALKELERTYGDIIPAQDLQLEKLREMKGDYDALTDAIRQKMEMQIHEQNVNQITESYASTLGTQRKNLEKYLKETGKYSAEEASRIVAGINKAINDGIIKSGMGYGEMASAIENVIEKTTGAVSRLSGSAVMNARSNFDLTSTYFYRMLSAAKEFNAELEQENNRFNALNNNLGKYSKLLENVRESLKKAPEGFTKEQEGTFEYNEARWKQAIQRYKDELIKAFEGIDISEAFTTPDYIDFSKIIKHITSGEGTAELKGFVNEIQKDYIKLAPQESTTRLVTEAATKFADELGVSMSKVQGRLKKDGQSMEDYAKNVQKFVEEQRSRIQELEFQQENYHPGVSNFIRPSDEDVTNEKKELSFLEKLLEFLKEFVKESNTGAKEDPWVILLKNRMKFMQDFQKGVYDMNKFLSQTDALGREQDIMKARGQALDINTEELVGTPEELRAWYNSAIDQVVAKIKELGGKKTFEGLSITEILAKDLKSKKIKQYQQLLGELWKSLTDFDTNQIKEQLDEKLKKLTDEIKRSETARNFYQNILDLTGDHELAATFSMNVYGGIGADFKERMQQQLNEALKSVDATKVTKELREAIANQDYDTILKNLDMFPEKWQDVLKQMAADSEKFMAERISNLVKYLQRAKSYSQERVEIERKSQERIAQIESLKADQSVKDDLLKQNAKKTAEEVAQAEYEAFKNTPLYVELFANLDVASSKMLKHMRDNLVLLKARWKDLNPTELKEMQSRLEEVEKQLAMRNPFKALITSIKAYNKLTSQRSRKDVENDVINADQSVIAAKARLGVAIEEYKNAKKTYGVNSEQAKFALRKLNAQKAATGAAIDEAEAAQNTAAAYRGAAQNIVYAVDSLKQWKKETDQLGDSVKEVYASFASEEDAAFFAQQYDNLNKAVSGSLDMASGIARAMANPADIAAYVQAIEGAADVVVGINDYLNGNKIKKANDTIKRQEKLLDELAYAYGRLEKAEEKALGADYIDSYQKRIANLTAQAEAYTAQARAERDKGKKKDKDKIRDYEKSARDIYDQIADMQEDVSQKFLGTDLTSAARDFASAWIEAYKEFGSTTDAIKERFQDMIQNMIVESLAARVVQNYLKDVFDEVDKLSKDDGQLSALDVAKIAQKTTEATTAINAGLTNLMAVLGTAGFNLRTFGSGLTGISKDIAGASEESILGLAAGVNTQNYYISHIDQNVSAILAVLSGTGASQIGTTPLPSTISYVNTDEFKLRMQTIDENLATLVSYMSRITTSATGTNTSTLRIAIK